jgi:hypothetical protein
MTWPGAQLLTRETLPASELVFVLSALAAISFDGLSHTFRWLALVGENPLEPPGRTAMMPANTLGLIVACATLVAAYRLSVVLGLEGGRSRSGDLAGRLAYAMVPIALGYHLAHYLPAFLLESQYALIALSDPFDLGWDLLGTAEWRAIASVGTHHRFIELVWYCQVAAIVVGHVAAVLVAHALYHRAGESGSALRGLTPLTALMVAYTCFGLWLLSTPAV